MNSDDIARTLEEALVATVDAPASCIPSESFSQLLAVDRSDLPPVTFEHMRDGLPLAVRVYPGPSDRWAVLVHGAGGHGAHLHAIARSLVANGAASVCVPDLRGNGMSGARRSDAVTYPEQLRDDLLDLLAALRRRRPAAQIVPVGHSAGGGLLLRLFGEGLDTDVAAIALLAPLLGGGPLTARPGLGGWVSLYGRRVQALGALNRRGVFGLNALTVMEFNQPPGTRDGRETLSWSFETMRAFGPGKWRQELAAAGGRAAVLIGEDDECFVAEAYPEAVAAVAPDAAVERLADCGHWDLLADARAAAWLAVRVAAA